MIFSLSLLIMNSSTSKKLCLFILTLLSIIFGEKMAVAELAIEEINSIARQTTVLIAPGLTPNLKEELEQNRNNPIGAKEGNRDSWQPGSGVIVGKEQGENKQYKYYVLTVAHNFKQRYLDTKEYWEDSGGEPFYGLRTGDGQVHIVKPLNDGLSCPFPSQAQPMIRGNLLRFGCSDRFLENQVYRGRGGKRKVIGTDLAIVTFETNTKYLVAPLGDSQEAEKGELVYVSGWPDPEKQIHPQQSNQCHPKQARRIRRLAWGPLISKKYPYKYGYSLMYVNITTTGMSGGPVFNQEGKVIGIHGVAPSVKEQLELDYEVLAKLESCDDTPTLSPITVNQSDSWETQSENSSGNQDNNWLNQSSNLESDDPFLSPANEDTTKGWGEEDLDLDQLFNDSELESQTTEPVKPPSLTTITVTSKKVSMAQDVRDALTMINQYQFNFPFQFESVSPEMITEGIVSLGEIKTTPLDHNGKYIDDPNDVVEDIYDIYEGVYQQMRRDRPSSGCKFLPVGDPCN